MKTVHPHCKISKDYHENITIHDSSALNETLTLLKNTSEKVIANYLYYRFFNDVDKTYLSGDTMINDCLKETNRNMGLAAYALFVRDHFNNSSEILIIEMVYYIRESVKNVLNQVSFIILL